MLLLCRNAVPTKEVGEKWKVVCEQARKELVSKKRKTFQPYSNF
jgi:hypothetical protein